MCAVFLFVTFECDLVIYSCSAFFSIIQFVWLSDPSPDPDRDRLIGFTSENDLEVGLVCFIPVCYVE